MALQTSITVGPSARLQTHDMLVVATMGDRQGQFKAWFSQAGAVQHNTCLEMQIKKVKMVNRGH